MFTTVNTVTEGFFSYLNWREPFKFQTIYLNYHDFDQWAYCRRNHKQIICTEFHLTSISKRSFVYLKLYPADWLSIVATISVTEMVSAQIRDWVKFALLTETCVVDDKPLLHSFKQREFNKEFQYEGRCCCPIIPCSLSNVAFYQHFSQYPERLQISWSTGLSRKIIIGWKRNWKRRKGCGMERRINLWGWISFQDSGP